MTQRYDLISSTAARFVQRTENRQPAESAEDRAYREAMDRIAVRQISASSRSAAEWAELNRILMDDEPVNLGNPNSIREDRE